MNSLCFEIVYVYLPGLQITIIIKFILEQTQHKENWFHQVSCNEHSRYSRSTHQSVKKQISCTKDYYYSLWTQNFAGRIAHLRQPWYEKVTLELFFTCIGGLFQTLVIPHSLITNLKYSSLKPLPPILSTTSSLITLSSHLGLMLLSLMTLRQRLYELPSIIDHRHSLRLLHTRVCGTFVTADLPPPGLGTCLVRQLTIYPTHLFWATKTKSMSILSISRSQGEGKIVCSWCS